MAKIKVIIFLNGNVSEYFRDENNDTIFFLFLVQKSILNRPKILPNTPALFVNSDHLQDKCEFYINFKYNIY